MSRVFGSALELTGQGFHLFGNPNTYVTEVYDAGSDGAPIGFAGGGGDLWRIDYLVTSPVTDTAADISFRSWGSSYLGREAASSSINA